MNRKKSIKIKGGELEEPVKDCDKLGTLYHQSINWNCELVRI